MVVLEGGGVVELEPEVPLRHDSTALGMAMLQSVAISFARVALIAVVEEARSQRQVEVSLEDRVLLRGVQHSGPGTEVLPLLM